VEVFVNGGPQTLTSLVFPQEGPAAARLASVGGSVSLTGATVTPLAATR
jgi:levanbiose-producing levanase